MSDQDPFNQTQNSTDGNPVTTQNDPFADQLSSIKNENGEQKYKDVDTALKALQESQQFIKQLKDEKSAVEAKLNEANTELTKMGSIDDFVNKLSPNTEPKADPATPANVEGLSAEKVAEMLDQRMAQQAQSAAEESNFKRVVEALSSVHGDKTAEHIKTKADELGTTPAALKDMAKTNPTMALAILGGAGGKSTAPSQSTTIPPMKPSDDNPMPKHERGIARGGLTNKELLERFRESKAYTNKKHGWEFD